MTVHVFPNVRPAVPPGAGQSYDEQPLVVGADGQTVFLLPTPLVAGGNSLLMVNGVDYEPGVRYTLVGNTLTWLNVPFMLQTTDDLFIFWQIG